MDDRYYPSEPIRNDLERYGIPRDKQDLLSLFDLLPKRFFNDNIRYYLEVTAYPVYTVKYIDENGLKYTDRSGERLADAVAGMVMVLLQKKVIM